jgi:hypothetical protein
MTFQATAIYKLPGDRYQLTEVAAETKQAAIARAERVAGRLGEAFAVAWDLTEDPRNPDEAFEPDRMAKLIGGPEMSWEAFWDAHREKFIGPTAARA